MKKRNVALVGLAFGGFFSEIYTVKVTGAQVIWRVLKISIAV